MSTSLSSRLRLACPGRPQGAALGVVPILGPTGDGPAYRLLDEDAAAASVRVAEVSDAGTVPELVVSNGRDARLFLMDGQELVGAKQNRILNADVMVPAGATLRIPVSCVEQGRWRRVSETFTAGRSASARTRSAKLSRVRASLRRDGRHDADQAAVWREVEMSLAQTGTASPTRALSDAYRQQEQELVAFRRSVDLPAGAVGVGVFVGSRLQGVDLFDRPSTLAHFWAALIDSYAVEALGAPAADAGVAGAEASDARAASLQEVLCAAADGTWEPYPSPGEGQDWRMEDGRLAGAALVCGDAVVHVQLFPKGPKGGDAIARQPRIHRSRGLRRRAE